MLIICIVNTRSYSHTKTEAFSERFLTTVVAAKELLEPTEGPQTPEPTERPQTPEPTEPPEPTERPQTPELTKPPEPTERPQTPEPTELTRAH